MSIVIVGAGPTGLAAANMLGQAGIPVTLIERGAGISEIPRAITIDDEGLRVCQAAGLGAALRPDILFDIEAQYLSRGRLLAHVAPRDKPNGHPLISTFHQPTFEAGLLNGLARFPHVSVLFGHTVEAIEQDEQGVRLTVRTPADAQIEMQCDYLLACDGGRSGLRQALAIALRPPTLRDLYSAPAIKTETPERSTREDSQAQRWLVVDTNDASDTTMAATFFCDPARPAVTVPAPQGGRRWEFMLLPGEQAETLLSEETIQELIKQARATQHRNAWEARETEPAHITRKAVYTFHTALATTFARERVFLLGDAAHLMPPFGGQGMNSGLRDVHNLCWKLALVQRKLAHPRLLQTYQQERFRHVATIIFFSALLGKLIMTRSRALAELRDLFFHALNVVPPARALLSEMRIKPRPRYSSGFLLPAHRMDRGILKGLRGSLLPQPFVTRYDGQRVLLDDVLCDGFALLRLYEDPHTAFTSLREPVWERLGVRYICIQPQETVIAVCDDITPSCITVVDSEGKMGTWLRDKREVYVLVRPDRFVMGVFHVQQTQRVADFLQRLLE